ncbi:MULTISPECIES: hypothetical protein [unclassified Streptomyces]|uniref:hypothetical protein n=1 Tax=unclassified Streptomyces TaxID=2593676 RepID=UPI00364F0E1F
MMITREQMTTATAGAVLLSSTALVVQGATSNPRTGRACMAIRVAFGALALVTIARNIRARKQADDTANSALREGYSLGLIHATNGLIPRTDSDGQGAPAQDATANLSAVPAQKSAKGPTNGKPL